MFSSKTLFLLFIMLCFGSCVYAQQRNDVDRSIEGAKLIWEIFKTSKKDKTMPNNAKTVISECETADICFENKQKNRIKVEFLLKNTANIENTSNFLVVPSNGSECRYNLKMGIYTFTVSSLADGGKLSIISSGDVKLTDCAQKLKIIE